MGENRNTGATLSLSIFYKDQRQIAFDLKVIESLVQVLLDVSDMVHYEVIIGFSSF